MPRVKIDYIVSFSSEDPEHPASNLLSREVSKKKWLCNKGETSCSVVLQLTKAVQISGVHIGVHHAALVEVLVARSETSSDQFEVLVASSVFVSPRESRGAALDRVRSFSGEQLAPRARAQRWDRLRVVCSQPYNKHCQYGLSFVHIDSAEDPLPPAPPTLQLLLNTHSSDEEDFKPGELFAKHLLKKNSPDEAHTTTNTGAQIRQATSHALKNLPDSSTRLTKTPINKPAARRDSFTSDRKLDRTRDSLLYTDDDQKPHAKIDTVVSKHKVEKEKDKETKHPEKPDKKEKEKQDRGVERNKDGSRESKKETDKRRAEHTPHYGKRPRTDDSDTASGALPLAGCVLVLSGYTHPRRAAVRAAALRMGARVRGDWGPAATHLICAFPNTPKLREVRQCNGDSTPVVLAEWVEQCCQHQKKLPWRQFATEPRHRRAPSPQEDKKEPARAVRQKTPDSDTECDTDDEIEKVLQKQKKRRTDDAPDTRDTMDTGDSSDGGATAPEAPGEAGEPPAARGRSLPDFFEGHTFVIHAAQPDAGRLSRYVRAYGGLVLQDSDCEEPVEYAVVGSGGDMTSRATHVVSAAWLARCHAARQLLPA